jgi:ApbE superfamily uncharacterized protein (UPF0280 family)
MKTWCLRDTFTGLVFKVFLNQEKLNEYLNQNPDLEECINCIECDDAPSICIE